MAHHAVGPLALPQANSGNRTQPVAICHVIWAICQANLHVPNASVFRLCFLPLRNSAHAGPASGCRLNTVLWALPGTGPGEAYIRFLYTRVDDETARTVRPEMLAIACAGWGVDRVDLLTPAQVAYSVNIVRVRLQRTSSTSCSFF